MLKSRRYFLTHDTDKNSFLYSLDDGLMKKKWQGVQFSEIKENMQQFDKYLNKVGAITPNIDLGVLKVSLDLSKWSQCTVEEEASNVLKPMGLEEPVDSKGVTNIGLNMIKMCFKGVCPALAEREKEDVKSKLGNNYKDYLKLR